jgi:hypothetical protein
MMIDVKKTGWERADEYICLFEISYGLLINRFVWLGAARINCIVEARLE